MKTWNVYVTRIREPGDEVTPVGWERHRARAEAVHAALRDAPDWSVQSWGNELDDRDRTHETAHLVLEWLEKVAQDPLVHSAVQQAMAVGGDAIRDLVKDGIVDIVKIVASATVGSLITRFIPSLKSKKVDSVYAEAAESGGEVTSVQIGRDPTKVGRVNMSISASRSLLLS